MKSVALDPSRPLCLGARYASQPRTGRLRTERSGRLSRRGSATLEFAILLPLLLTIAVLAIDYGRFAYHSIGLTNAARAGAGWAIEHPVAPATKADWDAEVRRVIVNELTGNGWFNSGSLTTPAPTVTGPDANGHYRISVSASYPFQKVLPFNLPFLPGYSSDITLGDTIVMRAIR